MAKGGFEVRTTPIAQPDANNTLKGQKRFRLPQEYDR